MAEMQALDFFHRANADYLEQLYAEYQRDPMALDHYWQAFFGGFEAGFEQPGRSLDSGSTGNAGGRTREPLDRLTQGVFDLVHSYRELAHCTARLDPLGSERPAHPLLALSESGLSDEDLDHPIQTSSFLGPRAATLRELVAQLEATYCGTIGVETMSITDKAQREWLQERIEGSLNRTQFSAQESRHILELLIRAETFEQFLHAKFVGQKRFSLEGAESLIPLVDTLIEHGAALGAEEMVMGMTHRGRLNVLANIIHKPSEIILSEFEGTPRRQISAGEGDVKYHMGYSHNRVTAKGHKIHCSLSSNPSHLELVDPVIEGMVRAKQERLGDNDRGRVVPVLIHGEAAFTGQGIVSETLGLSELPAYRTGGTIHIIVNNQVGFTATPEQTRFTPYPTDVAKMIQAPIFHVNADDPEAVVHVAQLAIAFRQQFKVDVMIDLWCYRRHGHNETDDPTFTQPMIYGQIEEHPTVTQIYAQRLMREGKLHSGEDEQIRSAERKRLDEALKRARQFKPRQRIMTLGGAWEGLSRAGSDWTARTAVGADVLRRIAELTGQLPRDFSLHRKLKRVLSARTEMAAGERLVDWGCAEMWAVGSLLLEGTGVRLTGQDVERGTFSHRHAVLHDVQNGTRYVPLEHLSENQGRFTITNTILSELGVLGFEYGFSSADPRTLVMWEAQFGDFANGAQTISDQFIASSESKWQRMSGIVLLLPHGYEGQGPEHSSARLERWLQLCAENNLQVCYTTQAAQYFHLLRRQMLRTFRKPLVLLTPKSLLRFEPSFSAIDDFTKGEFRPLIDDPARPDREHVQRLVLCSGRIFFVLQAAREERGADDIALVRIEQLYPFPADELQAVIARYRRAQEVYWVQEEPRNMGAWSFLEPRLRASLPDTCVLSYQGRDEAASPATGSFWAHEMEEKLLIERVFEGMGLPRRAKEFVEGDGSARET
jgi:2-oxoglutarate dehydrogenase E1 component